MEERESITVSIVVPIYNVEKYLEQCLNSLQNQTYKKLQIILINDGSPDKSKAICERYCKIDNRFQLINKDNEVLDMHETPDCSMQTANMFSLWILTIILMKMQLKRCCQ